MNTTINHSRFLMRAVWLPWISIKISILLCSEKFFYSEQDAWFSESFQCQSLNWTRVIAHRQVQVRLCDGRKIKFQQVRNGRTLEKLARALKLWFCNISKGKTHQNWIKHVWFNVLPVSINIQAVSSKLHNFFTLWTASCFFSPFWSSKDPVWSS